MCVCPVASAPCPTLVSLVSHSPSATPPSQFLDCSAQILPVIPTTLTIVHGGDIPPMYHLSHLLWPPRQRALLLLFLQRFALFSDQINRLRAALAIWRFHFDATPAPVRCRRPVLIAVIAIASSVSQELSGFTRLGITDLRRPTYNSLSSTRAIPTLKVVRQLRDAPGDDTICYNQGSMSIPCVHVPGHGLGFKAHSHYDYAHHLDPPYRRRP